MFDDHYDDYLDGEDDNFQYDYDYYGPNHNGFNSSGFHGYGFDDMNDGDQNTPQPIEPIAPPKSLNQYRLDDPILYEQMQAAIMLFARNRHFRMLKKTGQSAGYEKFMQQIEADIDAGFSKLDNANVEGTRRCCLFEFNVYSGEYELSPDSVDQSV